MYIYKQCISDYISYKSNRFWAKFHPTSDVLLFIEIVSHTVSQPLIWSMSRFSRYWQKFKNQAPSIFQKGSPARTVVVEFLMIYSGVYVFTSNVVGFTLCVGPSMLPTIDQNGELAFIDRFNYKFARKDYKVGDVVISDSMDDPNKSKIFYKYCQFYFPKELLMLLYMMLFSCL